MVGQKLYCGGPSAPLRNWVGSPREPADPATAWPQLRDRVVLGTYSGRSAVALACNSLGIGGGDEVLVPAYHCGTEIDAVLHSGAGVVAYQVTRRGEADLDDLFARRSSRTRAVYLIHYFGWEQPMVDLRRWCDQEGLALIEDCALALFSEGVSGSVGRTGEAAIFSLPKSLGLFHGGLLSLSASPGAERPQLAATGFGTLLEELLHSGLTTAYSGLERLGLYGAWASVRQRLRGHRPHLVGASGLAQMPDDYYFKSEVHGNRALHPRALAAAGALSWREVAARRRRNYSRLADELRDVQPLTPFFSQLPAGVCPLSLPLLASNRDACVELLNAHGIPALPWWAGFHNNAIDWCRFPEACWLKQHLLTLPVHQGLDDRHVDYLADTTSRALRITH